MDPQQRWALEVSYHAFENGAYQFLSRSLLVFLVFLFILILIPLISF